MTKEQNLSSKSQPLYLGAHLDSNGLSIKTNLRLFKAFDHFVGSVIDYASGIIEHNSRRKKADHNRIESLDKIKTKAEIDQARKDTIKEREIQKQLNRESIAFIALDNLQSTTWRVDNDSDHDATLSDDWLNYFGDFAEKASSEALQSLWGKILAGEIRKPGSFSRKTLRFIAELDQEYAQIIQDNLKYIYSNGNTNVIFKTADMYGPNIINIITLEELGILSGFASTTQIQLFTNEHKKFQYPHHNTPNTLLLLGILENNLAEIPAIIVSRLGMELYRLLSPQDEMEVLEALSIAILPHAKKLEIVRVIEQITTDDGSEKFSYEPIKVLKS